MCYKGGFSKRQICFGAKLKIPTKVRIVFLKFESMKSESLVIANQHVAVNLF